MVCACPDLLILVKAPSPRLPSGRRAYDIAQEPGQWSKGELKGTRAQTTKAQVPYCDRGSGEVSAN